MQTACQIYVRGSAEAAAFYQKAFGWTMGMNYQNPDGSYAHASLMSGEREMLALAEDGDKTGRAEIRSGKWPVMSFNCFDLKSREAVDRAYNVLLEGALAIGNPTGPAPVPWSEYCFSLVDKFGVSWWVAI